MAQDSNTLGFVFFCSPLSAWPWVERGVAEQTAPGRKIWKVPAGGRGRNSMKDVVLGGVNWQIHPDPGSGSAGSPGTHRVLSSGCSWQPWELWDTPSPGFGCSWQLWQPWDTPSPELWMLLAALLALGPQTKPLFPLVPAGRNGSRGCSGFSRCQGRLKLCPQDTDPAAFSLPAPVLSHSPPVWLCWVWDPLCLTRSPRTVPRARERPVAGK